MNDPALFTLHPQLQDDAIRLGRFSLCQVLLMNESRYPWLILVPQRPGVSEIHELADDDQVRLRLWWCSGYCVLWAAVVRSCRLYLPLSLCKPVRNWSPRR